MKPRSILNISEIYDCLHAFKHENEQFSVIVFDQRDLKGLNRTHGIQKTDQVLKIVGEIIDQEINQVFESSTYQGPQGRHYVCIKTQSNRASFGAKLKVTIAQIRASLTHHFAGAVDVRYAQLSIPENAHSIDDLILKADQLLEAGKAKGKTAAFMNDVERLSESNTRHALKNAMTHGEFILHYQPIVCSKSHKIQTVEALSRWNHPMEGLKAPNWFIDDLTKHQLMDEFGISVCQKAIEQLSRWRQESQENEHIVISINLSLQQLKTSAFFDGLQEILVTHNVPPSRVQLEVTEDLIAEPATIEQLNRLSDAGILLAIDDFGSGTSNISRLREIHADVVKIDKQIMRDCFEKKDLKFLNSMVGMCRAMSPDTKVIVEGVETPEQETLVRESGADAIQGFLFFKPAPAEQVVLI